MHEHHRQLGVAAAGTQPLAAHQRGLELVDLDVQRNAVVGDDGQRIRAQRAEGRLVADASPGDDPAPLRDAQRGAGGRHADGAGREPENAAGGAHWWSPS